MANTMRKLITILFLLISALALHSSEFVSSTDADHDDINEEEEYVLDTPLLHFGPRDRFLVSKIKKGRRCNRVTNNICNGVRANKGRDLLFCCKMHCRNVLSDKNHCGVCLNKCAEGEHCCNGVCTNVMTNVHHCGKCKEECSPGDTCRDGMCGYA
ncbi:hypothetical protein VNO77_28239 [Canavalia gladiata]|uniref:Uncharacterized protein n=1 Tax=Canavalia gladiata TaxID=3824 RepID=A0AAN9KVW3_CANGL